METVKQFLKRKGWDRTIKDSGLFKYYSRRTGDPFYFIYWLCWTFSKILKIRRNTIVNGIKLNLPVTNYVTHFRWYLIKKKEPEVREWVDQFVKNGDTLFDIGGNMAMISMYATKKHKNLKVLCFEPEYSNLALIKDNLKANKLRDKISVYSIGFSDFTGISMLHIQDEEHGAAAHTENRKKIDKTDEGYNVVWQEGIATFMLDDFCKLTGETPNALKIDTDGNELKILNGAKAILNKPELRTIIIETPPIETAESAKCSEILKSAGFITEKIIGNNSFNRIWNRTVK